MLIRQSSILASFALVGSLFTSDVHAVPSLSKRSFSGDGTFYSTGLGACGQVSSDSSYIAALNKPQWGNPPNPNQNPICGKQAIVHGPKGSVTVTIVDLCPECLYGSLDMSPGAFNQIADAQQGRVPITWDWADGGAPAPPPPPPPPAATTTPTPPPTPTLKLLASTTTTTSATSTTSTSKAAKPTPSPEHVPSVSYVFWKGSYPFGNHGAVLPNGSNPFANTKSFVNGVGSDNSASSSSASPSLASATPTPS